MERTHRLIDYEAIQENEPLQLGDNVRLNGQLYYVNEVIYEGGIGAVPPIIRYELELLQPVISADNTFYTQPQAFNRVSILSSSINKVRPVQQEEDISPETRKEFIKLLE